MKISVESWIGKKCGRLTVVGCVVEPLGDKNSGGVWRCRCICGREVEKSGYRLSPIKPDANVGCGCALRKPPLDDRKLVEAVAMYRDGKSIHVIAKHFGTHPQSIWKPLKRAGVEMRTLAQAGRRFPVNEDVFSRINEASAYWAGFLMADGCVQKGSTNSYTTSLELAVVDTAHVEAFRNYIAPTASITTCVRRTGDSCKFAVRSQRLGEDLIQLGVTERKTLAAKVCDVLALDRHFWRGVVDGDGSIGQQGGYWHVSLVGSEPLLKQFAVFCGAVIPGFVPSLKPTASVFRISIAGRKAGILLKAIYRECGVALERKLKLAETAIATCESMIDDRVLIYTGQRNPVEPVSAVAVPNTNPPSRASSHRLVTVGNETNTIKYFAELHGQVPASVYARIDRLGWTLDEALGIVPRSGGRGTYQTNGTNGV